MTIRPTETTTRRATPAAGTPAVQPPATPAAEARPAVPAAARTGFDGTVSPRQSELARAEAGQTHVAGSILPGDGVTIAPGPLSLRSVPAQLAITKASEYIEQNLSLGGSRNTLDPQFEPRSVEVDALGMTHVRMDRVQNGLKVLGEQVIAHLDRDGNVVGMNGGELMSAITVDAARQEPHCSKAKAVEIASQQFGRVSQHNPVVEQVLVRKDDGSYTKAYRVELTDFTSARPQRMNYLVDCKDGQVLDSWNQMGGIELPKAGSDVVGRPGRSDQITVTQTAEPNAAIEDLQTVTSTLDIAEEVTTEQLELDLDIPHTWKGDLRVTLTSPSGKEVVVHDRTGGSVDDVRGSFDLSAAFAGEQAKGTWTLKVEDKAKRDVGTLKSWGLTVTGQGKPQPKGDDSSLYAGTVDLQTTQNPDGTYKLEDGTRGQGVVTKNAQNKSSGSGAIDFVDANDTWGEAGDPATNKAAVDAHYGAQTTYDFYKDVLGRDSIDGKGEKLVSNVHIRQNYVNAYWDGKTMNYGDGDGKNASALTTLDIAGHEITHGLTERTAGLIYRGESGGINEAMSDIMGTGVEWYAAQKNAAVKFDWTLGEDAWTPNNGDNTDGLRYMDDPTKDRYSIDHYSNYPKQTEVHGSSGIMNNAFFLLSDGGTNRTSKQTVEGGIGPEKSFQIYGRALMFYMTPNTNFKGAREATIKAAADLFGAESVEVQKVKDSWSAVGVQ